MSHTDRQLMTDVREAVRAAPPRTTVALDEVIAVGRRRVRARRSVGAAGVLVAAAVAGAVAFSLAGVGPLSAAPSDVAGEPTVDLEEGVFEPPEVPQDLGEPTVDLEDGVIEQPPEVPQYLKDALDARLEAMGLEKENEYWRPGAGMARNFEVRSAYTAHVMLDAPSHVVPVRTVSLETVRTKEPVDLTGDLCEWRTKPDRECTQSAGPDGTQLLRISVPQSGFPDSGELVALHVVRPGGWVRVTPSRQAIIEGEARPPLAFDEATLLEIVSDPALQW